MPKLSKFILLSGIIIHLCCNKCLANHVYGADISYIHDSGSTYKVVVNAYEDCKGATTPYSDIYMQGDSSFADLGATLCCSKDITPIAKNACDYCSNSYCSFSFGVTKWTYTAKVDLGKYPGCKFRFFWVACCTGSVSNSSSGGSNLYVECSINRCHTDQSGPAFQFDPLTVINDNLVYDGYQSVVSGDKNDSVVYSVTEPLSGNSSPMTYVFPYSYQYPFDCGSVFYKGSYVNYFFHYDQASGELIFKPDKIQTTFLAVKAEEYKKSASGAYYLAGNTTRCTIVTVVANYSSNTPEITGITGASSDTVVTCAGIPLTLNIATYVQNSDTLSVLNETGGKISISKATWPTATLTWTPQNKDISTVPYRFTITAADQSSPLPGVTQRRFYILVKDSTPDTHLKIQNKGCGKYQFSTSPVVDSAYHPQFQWFFDSKKISDSPSVSYSNGLVGRIPVALVLTTKSGCTQVFNDTVVYAPQYHLLGHDTSICTGGLLQLHAFKGKNIHWLLAKNLSDSTIYNPVARVDSTTTFYYSATDSSGCPITDRVNVRTVDVHYYKAYDNEICTFSNNSYKYLDSVQLYVYPYPPQPLPGRLIPSYT